MAGRNLALQLGLLSVACKSETATEKARTDMVNLCVGQPDHSEHPASPLKAPKTCTSCGEITDYAALVKGVKQGDTYAVVTQEDVAEAKETYTKAYKGTLSLVPHPAQQFLAETGPGDTLHYLTPKDSTSEGHYQLLVKLVESHPEYVFASLYTPVSATALYMLRVREGVLLMEKRTRTQNMKPAPSVGGEVNEALFAQLDSMLEMFVTEYDAEAYEDRYESALALMVEDAEHVTVNGTTAKAPIVRHDDNELLAKLQALAGEAKKPAAKKKTTKKKVAA